MYEVYDVFRARNKKIEILIKNMPLCSKFTISLGLSIKEIEISKYKCALMYEVYKVFRARNKKIEINKNICPLCKKVTTLLALAFTEMPNTQVKMRPYVQNLRYLWH